MAKNFPFNIAAIVVVFMLQGLATTSFVINKPMALTSPGATRTSSSFSSYLWASDDEEEKPPILLPPIGESSFVKMSAGNNEQPKMFVGSEKFAIQYTCKICDTRNTHKVSRMGM